MKEVVRIENYVPEYIREYREPKLIYEKENQELKKIWDLAEELLKNLFIESADERGIKRLEAIAGIKNGSSMSLEDRRLCLLAKWNEQLPYTYRSLRNWLLTNLGTENFDLNLYPEQYKLDLVIREYSNQFMKSVRKQIHGMIPANIDFLAVGNYLQQFEHHICTESALTIKSEFYPRYNLKPLLLDNTWLLDGAYKLNGYRAREVIDFYPVCLTINGGAEEEVKTESELLIESELCPEIAYELENTFESYVPEEIKTESELTLQSDIQKEIEVEANLRIEKDLWLLNGSVLLDGSRLLDAKIIKMEL